MVRGFRIHLAEEKRSWYSGQNFAGAVHFELDKHVAVKGVLLNIIGVGVVHWWSHALDSDHGGTSKLFKLIQVWEPSDAGAPKEHHEATEVYIDDEYWLLGDGVRATTLSPGKYNYSFDIQLPLQLPASFDSERGTIEYELVAHLYTERGEDCTHSVPITILGYLDLSTEPGAMHPVSHSATQTFRCCCTKGSITMTVRMSEIGHLALDSVKFEVEVHNDSEVTVEGIEATLLQHVRYHANNEHEETIQVLCSTLGPSVFPRTTMTWTEPNLVIPKVVPTSLGGISKIMDAQYFFQFCPTVDAKCASVPTLNIPIIIGTPRFRYSVMTVAAASGLKSKGGSISPRPNLPTLPHPLINKFIQKRNKRKGTVGSTQMILSAKDTITGWRDLPESVTRLAVLSRHNSTGRGNDELLRSASSGPMGNRSTDSSWGIFYSSRNDSN